MFNFIIVLLLTACAYALEAVVSVNPDFLSSPSTMTLTLIFDESLGRGGTIKINVADDPYATALNLPLEFSVAA